MFLPDKFFDHSPWLFLCCLLCLWVAILIIKSREVSFSDLFDEPVLLCSLWVVVGLFFAALYALCVETIEEAFNSTLSVPNSSFVQYIYFSFVTLSTLGYGDIQPNSPVVKVAAIIESMLGLLLASGFALSLANKVRSIRTFVGLQSVSVSEVGGRLHFIFVLSPKKEVWIENFTFCIYASSARGRSFVGLIKDKKVDSSTSVVHRVICNKSELSLTDISSGIFTLVYLRVSTVCEQMQHIRYYKLNVDDLKLLATSLEAGHTVANLYIFTDGPPLKKLPQLAHRRPDD
jgi:hypothetical protein